MREKESVDPASFVLPLFLGVVEAVEGPPTDGPFPKSKPARSERTRLFDVGADRGLEVDATGWGWRGRGDDLGIGEVGEGLLR